MTSHKLILFGFLIIALGFAFLLIALTGIAATPNTLPANLFVSNPSPPSQIGSNITDLADAVQFEQGIGLALVITGVITGAVGCYRKDGPTRP